MKLTDEQIDNIIKRHGPSREDMDDSFDFGRAIIKQCVREALSLAAEPEPKTPWPAGPFTVAHQGYDLYRVESSGYQICDNTIKTEAEAIALALTLLPEYVAMLRNDPYNATTHRVLLAKWDDAGFEMPGDRPSTKETT